MNELNNPIHILGFTLSLDSNPPPCIITCRHYSRSDCWIESAEQWIWILCAISSVTEVL